MADFDTWVTVQRLEAELRNRAIARCARLGPLPEQRGGWLEAVQTRVGRLLRRLLRRPTAAPATAATSRSRPVCQGRTLAARRPCRICGARGHGAAAFRPGYRPHRCSRRLARGKTRI
jgi:hypothetical protein